MQFLVHIVLKERTTGLVTVQRVPDPELSVAKATMIDEHLGKILDSL